MNFTHPEKPDTEKNNARDFELKRMDKPSQALSDPFARREVLVQHIIVHGHFFARFMDAIQTQRRVGGDGEPIDFCVGFARV